MDTVSSQMTVADYTSAMDRGDIIVNREYQRSDKVWPDVARSFLIETLLLGYPLPKLSLYQRTDVKSRRTIKEIVDGQQRSKAIYDFINGEYKLSKTLETEDICGKYYDDLDETYQSALMEFPLAVDLFMSATPGEIREAFRRMNSYTVPLNPEEQRHAEFQGEFKWFAYSIAKDYDNIFTQIGLFSDKQIVRMQDVKLITELADAILFGIRTTKKTELNSVYKSRDKKFTEKKQIEARLRRSFDAIANMDFIAQGKIMRPHNAYALILAHSHCIKPHAKLNAAFRLTSPKRLNPSVVQENLSYISELLSLPEDEIDDDFIDFYKASTVKTNVSRERKIRFKTYCEALLGRW